MGPPMVVEVQMLLERPVDVGHPQLPVVEGPELTAGGWNAPVRRSVVLGPSWGQHIEGEAEVLTGGLELGLNSDPPSTWREVMGKGISWRRGLEEAGGIASGGASVAAHDRCLLRDRWP